MIGPAEKEILELKKARFIEEVENSAKYQHVPKPSVKFWGISTHFNDGERAHIHRETNTICISERELGIMTYEDIRTTASHEVSHINNPSHDDQFISKQIETEAGLWTPPPGVLHIVSGRSSNKINKKEDKKKKKKVKDRCNYHLCKKKGKTELCSFCDGYFCKDHINPTEPNVGVEYEDKIKDNKTHPCFGYNMYLNKKKEQENKEYTQALDKMFNKHRNLRQEEMNIPEKGVKEEKNIEKEISSDLRNIVLKNLKREEQKSYSNNMEDYEDNGRYSYSKKEHEFTEMYHPKEGVNFKLNFRNPFRNIFSFHLSSEIRDALTQFILALFIGLGLNYVYYTNVSLYYLFISGVQEWFVILSGTLNYGLGGGYNLLYLIINGFFYFYLYSTTIRLFYAMITNLDKKGTWWFLGGLAISLFAIFKYFPNLVY